MCEFGDLRPTPKNQLKTFDLELIFKPITFVEGSKVIHMCEFGEPQSVGEENFEILPQKTKNI